VTALPIADGTPPGGRVPDERITMAQAVESYTLGSACAEFAEGRTGSNTEEQLADFVVLSQDIFTIPPRQILDTTATLTVVGGRMVHDAGAIGATSAAGR
jgi:predicted amidohydrolase YtcJ